MKDLLLFKRATWMLCDFSRRTRVRAAAQTGTARVLCWQSHALCEASALALTEAERLVAHSMLSRQVANRCRLVAKPNALRITTAPSPGALLLPPAQTEL